MIDLAANDTVKAGVWSSHTDNQYYGSSFHLQMLYRLGGTHEQRNNIASGSKFVDTVGDNITGSLGINNATPLSPLHIKGSTNTNAILGVGASS